MLAGAWETALGDDSECFLLWAVPTWQEWADREKARRHDPGLGKWKRRTWRRPRRSSRILLVDSALSPMRLGRQPARADRTEEWKD